MVYPWIYHVYPSDWIIYMVYPWIYMVYHWMYIHGIYVVYRGISMDIPSFLKPDFAAGPWPRAAGLIQCAHVCG